MRNLELSMSSLRNADIHEALNEDWASRIFNPASDPSASERLLTLRREWSGQNGDWPSTTAFTCGVYDLLHLDHHGYLVHTKALAAEHHFDKYYAANADCSWDDLDGGSRNLWWREFISNGELRLVVSVDGNSRVASRKNGNPDKGNSTRPILDWLSRARAVAALTIPTVHDQHVPVVDAVTIHDELELAGTNHANLSNLASSLQPDVWSVYSESTDILEGAAHDPRLAGIDIKCIDDSSNYFDDPLLKGRFTRQKSFSE